MRYKNIDGKLILYDERIKTSSQTKKTLLDITNIQVSIDIKEDNSLDIILNNEIYIKYNSIEIIKTGLKLLTNNHLLFQLKPNPHISMNTPLYIYDYFEINNKNNSRELILGISNKSKTKNNFIFPYNINQTGNKEGDYLLQKGDVIANLSLYYTPEIEINKIKKLTLF